MSDRDRPEREWRFYIDDMIAFAQNAQAYTNDMSQAEFIADRRTFDATLRNLELIGEAASNVPAAIREKHEAVPWRMMIATRNRLIHAYLGIDNDTVWSIIRDDLPDLLRALEAIARDRP